MLDLIYDIVVIGSGPAGATTARFAAMQGLKVLMVDKRQELGAPIQCSGAVSRHGLEEVGVEGKEEFVHEAIYGFKIYNSQGADTCIDYRQLKANEYGSTDGRKPLGYVIDRRRFDRYLMMLAERAGAEVWLKTEGLGYSPNSTKPGYAEVYLRRFNKELKVHCRILVGADGLQSQVGKWAGLRTHLKITELASCLQFIVDNVVTEGLLEIITGHEWAPGGYAWVFPKGNGYAEIGLGVVTTMSKHNAQWYLDKFIRQSFLAERFAKAKVLEIQGGGVPLAAPLRQQYADRVILVGDAGRHVNPITGGGIHTALNGGKIAGNFLAKFLENGHSGKADDLKAYQDQWFDELGNKMWKLYDIKTNIFRESDIALRDEQLYQTMSGYFSPQSEFKKI